MTNRSISLWAACALIWQLPLAILSLLFFKTARCLLRGLVNLHYRLHPDEACRWRTFSAENLKKPFALPYLMTNAPRLNLHAIAAGVGPLPVTHSLSVDVSAANRSARSWSLVVYAVSGAQTVTSISPMNSQSESDWHTLNLAPGTYAIVLRFYHWSQAVACPAVRVDGRDAVAPLAIPADVTEFYHDLPRKSSTLYFCFHYHIYLLLRYRAWLPPAFVERQFLPVGNPDTQFHYGVLEPDERLTITVDQALLDSHDVFLSFYDRSSFPIQWSQIDSVRTTTPPCNCQCMYLIRVHPIRAESGGPFIDALTVEVVRGGKSEGRIGA